MVDEKPKFRRGLKSWEAAMTDNASATGIGSSLDIPVGRSLNDIEQSGTLDFLAHVMRFDPRKTEVEILDKLNDQIDTLMKHAYRDIDDLIDNFYMKVDEVKDDFSQLASVDLERMILGLQKVIYLATDTVSSLYNEAYFADRIQQDEYWASYRKPESKATIGDRQAHAYEETRDSRFYYYYRYMLWRRMSEKLSALREMQKTLEWYRSRTIKDRPFHTL